MDDDRRPSRHSLASLGPELHQHDCPFLFHLLPHLLSPLVVPITYLRELPFKFPSYYSFIFIYV